MKKGFAPVIIISSVFAILLVGLVFAFILSKNSNKQENTNSNVNPVVAEFLTPPPTPIDNTLVVPLVNAWAKTKKYTNPKIDISFEYPSYFGINQVDIVKENKEWADKYKNDPNVRQPLYKSAFAVSFFTPEVNSRDGSDKYTLICDNKMTVGVQQYNNSENLALYDIIADLNKNYPGDGQTESFVTYKKNLAETSIPKTGSYVFEGIIGENPVKEVYFTKNNNVYLFHLIGNCDTGGQYTKDADRIFQNVLESINL